MAVIEDWIWQDPDRLDAISEIDVINIFETLMTYHSAKGAVYLGHFQDRWCLIDQSRRVLEQCLLLPPLDLIKTHLMIQSSQLRYRKYSGSMIEESESRPLFRLLSIEAHERARWM
ncbi:uncharacterized protein MELLADRAFT_114637 [Melampsora larici-populina 98AG31]|uniref:Uncharacterized protein n=1 Tax=Melampsora larici-populina (strain 98AG31 / pathotype 3-4-7) TaxID=747676 RepID=F4SE81_MELLP|nr:uncharacterized protein MELLADRAFT_114637 [Melampsora larici-populina 98AG31]EGF97045.1 hypothetical protein MELLADRAFT_114637 [Melampsora larici-populina 98AG31]